jgi:hypothetical protein
MQSITSWENNVAANGRLPVAGHWVLLTLGWALIAVSLGGCGDRGPQRVIVSGRVTYNGKPISSGVILFVPLPSCPVPSAAAEITDGKYRVDARGGVPVGTHKIKIEGYRKPANAPQPSTAALSGLPAPTLREQYVPSRYNAGTQLEITIPSGSGTITKDFDLTD